MKRGHVSLVGAGPGDPDFLTRAAVRRLRRADLVLFDALVSTDVLRLARRARRFFVGKRAGRPAISQETINRLLVRAARRGLRVVRLKAGDPFVFGRGGEEALALAAAGVAFEVVPGVSAAVAAPALAGIPVTHRGVASGFAVITGHAESVYGPIVDALAPNALTLVVLMGRSTRSALASRLVARGWRPATPAAVIAGAATPDAAVWTGTLAGLAREPLALPAGPPATIVIGDVVALGARIGAREPTDVQDIAAGARPAREEYSTC